MTTLAPPLEPLASAEPQAHSKHHESFKDTVESLLVALILAFVFRAFIVEAFIIPTGSMAPTLYGAHATILCEDCGTEFAYGLRDLDDRRGPDLVKTLSRAICPNCAHPNTNLKISDESKNPEKGDRILVLKWPFDIGIDAIGPQRWDVIVFKDPADGVTNFIKRLVGLPNEVLMVIDGDVYAAPLDKLSQAARDDFESQLADKARFQAKDRDMRGRLRSLDGKTLNELDGLLEITPKTPQAQQALWHVVYDHDHPPRDAHPGQPQWRAAHGEESGWDATHRRVTFTNKGETTDYLEFSGEKIRAFNAYNLFFRSEPPAVADVRLHFAWTPQTEASTIRVRLNKLGRSFWATIGADGAVRLDQAKDLPLTDDTLMAAAQVSPIPAGRTVAIAFQNVDYRLSLEIADEVVLTSSIDPNSKAYYKPDVAGLRKQTRRGGGGRLIRIDSEPQPPRIYAEAGDSELAHIVLSRDEYYYLDDDSGLPGAQWAPSAGWANVDAPMYLRGHEFFMLGDNTAASKDSRLWDVIGPHLVERGAEFQLGTVPRDQLIGKAFFVYWPSGHRLEWLPIPRLNTIGLVPDVGRMRWIR